MSLSRKTLISFSKASQHRKATIRCIAQSIKTSMMLVLSRRSFPSSSTASRPLRRAAPSTRHTGKVPKPSKIAPSKQPMRDLSAPARSRHAAVSRDNHSPAPVHCSIRVPGALPSACASCPMPTTRIAQRHRASIARVVSIAFPTTIPRDTHSLPLKDDCVFTRLRRRRLMAETELTVKETRHCVDILTDCSAKQHSQLEKEGQRACPQLGFPDQGWMAEKAELETSRAACRVELDKMPDFTTEGNQLRFGSAFVVIKKNISQQATTRIDWLFEFDVLETSTVVLPKGLRRESGTMDL